MMLSSMNIQIWLNLNGGLYMCGIIEKWIIFEWFEFKSKQHIWNNLYLNVRRWIYWDVQILVEFEWWEIFVWEYSKMNQIWMYLSSVRNHHWLWRWIFQLWFEWWEIYVWKHRWNNSYLNVIRWIYMKMFKY